jgi:hypothetical protein
LQARAVTTSLAGTELNTKETNMTLNEMLNPWAALRRAKIEVDILRREQTLLLDELKKAQKKDQRSATGKFKKGEGK